MISILQHFRDAPELQRLLHVLQKNSSVHLSGVAGSSAAFVCSALRKEIKNLTVCILPDKETAAYFLNDMETISSESGILFYPESYRRTYQQQETDNSNVMLRTEVLSKIAEGHASVIVTYPGALSEKVITKEQIQERTIRFRTGEKVDLDFILDLLIEYDFEREDFVYEPGQFALRGGIIDVFSYSEELPYRIEFMGDSVHSIRTFRPDDQLSVKTLDEAEIVPNIDKKTSRELRQHFSDYLPSDSVFWIWDTNRCIQSLDTSFEKAVKEYGQLSGEIKHVEPEQLYTTGSEFLKSLQSFRTVYLDAEKSAEMESVDFRIQPEPVFNKNFELLLETLDGFYLRGYTNFFLSDQEKQNDRLRSIFHDLMAGNKKQMKTSEDELYVSIKGSVYEGFIAPELKIACFCDHRIFERHKRFKLKTSFSKENAITLKELGTLNPGDYVTHVDHGIGQFAGLEKMEVNGKIQEAVKLIYRDRDVLYVSIHSLHRIAKYTGKEGTAPAVHKLGSGVWEKTKAKTKKRIKELAFDLIQLYAKRKAQKGFAFAPDHYMQHELEASFIYEDTPDQSKATTDVKRDMEKAWPMDRLVCGDVGFGKTEVAIRAAFKAVLDGKQVAVLVPTTILALQHFKTFSARLKEFPVKVDYINRFKSAKQQKDTLVSVEKGETDILIGTHRITANDIKFKDLGLLIVDEEQKFGVNVKEKLKTLKVNVDTLTLTATPIPRTLQFSLMGARDLSIIRTPPPNRYPIITELHTFDEVVLRDAISYELQRNGQVYFVHNRVNDIADIAGLVQRLCPDARVRIAHGQMDGAKLEEVMLDFIEGEFDVLVSTAIVEAGLDVPNANTIIINQAHNFGLSDLHQLRGRVGRSNKKAFCYLLCPPVTLLTDEARKRMRAIIEFSELGSGFNISMRDLDIRGAGDLLGAEQSGFINDIGYETYQKILNEALQELKETHFAELFKEENEQRKDWTEDCIIDTDMEVLIPPDYVDQITERLNLYKELDSIPDEGGLEKFEMELTDRFGPMPAATVRLIETMRMRMKARSLGIEKLILKNGTLILNFTGRESYYKSDTFSKIIAYLQKARSGEMKQKGDKLSLIFKPVPTVNDAILRLNELRGDNNSSL